MNKQEMGRLAEEAATGEYIKIGYKTIAKNFRWGRIGEIDIILSRLLQDESYEVVFCEVKCRSDVEFATPSLAVNYKKQERIRKLAQIFLCSHDEFFDAQLRFDVAEVEYKDKIFNVNILENAF